MKKMLSVGDVGDDVATVHKLLESHGFSVPAAEVARTFFGPGTRAALGEFQRTKGISESCEVCEKTAAVLAAVPPGLAQPVGERPQPASAPFRKGLAAGSSVDSTVGPGSLTPATEAQFLVRGQVRDQRGNPFADGFVEIFSQGPSGEQAIGKSPLNAADGSYQISYRPPPSSIGRVDLRVAVLNAGDLVETTPSGASILTNAGPLEVVNFVLSGAANQPLSEFELILENLKPLLGGRSLAGLTEDAISLLASQSGYSPEQVAALVLAHQFEEKTRKPAAIFYGLFREGLPADVLALDAAHQDVKLNALKRAVARGVVPREIGGKKIEDYLSPFAPSPASKLRGTLGGILNANELDAFVSEFLKDSQNPDAFWKKIAAVPALANRAEKLRLTAQVAGLTDNNEPLVAKILAMPEIKQASHIVRLTKDKWKALIRTPGVGVPEETPGATADEKVNNYVQQIVAQVEAAFPTQFLAERLGATPVAAVFKHPAFDVRKTHPGKFFAQNPNAVQSLTPKERGNVGTLVRLYRLTNNADEAIGLSPMVSSAQTISRMDPIVFAKQTERILSPGRAKEVHDQALRTNAIALALLVEHGTGLNRTALHALPKLDLQAINDSAESGIPDWETLFGGFDFCACQECSSAHGPAAYFVDVLKFLDERKTGERSAKDVLFDRRPDLGDIELSCENTNIVLPLIDLVNEVMENAVAPPPPFVPLTLAPALEADLAQTVATAALAAAFNPPLQPGARVEALETGKRWRLWDEPFAYSVVKEDNALKVAARSRQTSGSTEARRATPQYRNSAAYAELAQSVYPGNLPFDLAGEEANVFLEHLGVSRRDLIEALRPTPEPFDPNSPVVVRLAAERLGLTDTERQIIAGEPLTPPRPPEDFWGSAPLAVLPTVRELLDRSGLSYAELEALAATWFINPTNAVTISAKPVDTCDTTKLKINGLNADVLSRLHRFVRLWRRLGWTIPEVDRALHALAPDPNTPVLTNEVLVRLDHLRTLYSQLRLPVAPTLALWKPIDTAEPGSLYRSLFYNPAVFKPQHEDFRLRPDGQELVQGDKPLTDHAAALQAAFRLSAASFALLAAKTNGKLSLANLSLLYRHATMARQLGLTVQDLLTAIDLTGLDPFQADRSQNTLRFVEVVKAIRASGFDFPQLDYLLRHRFNPAASFVPVDSTLAQTLTEVRAGLLKIDAPSDAEKQQLQESSVVDRIAAALGLPADVTGALLARVSHGGETARQQFLALSAILDTALPLSRANAKPQFETLEKLLKIASIIQALKLPGSQLDWLFRENSWLAVAPDPPANPVPFANWFTLIQLQQLRQDLTLEDAALDAILSAGSAVVVAADQTARLAAKKAFVEALSGWLGWPQEDLETLVGKSDNLGDLGLLNARAPDDYRGLDLAARIGRAMSLVKRLSVTAAEANLWCGATVTDANAKAIRGAAKAKYDDDAWQKLVIPLQNSLRDKQREALVSYLVARPAKWRKNPGKADANDLYSHFLIDVEMSSCQLTSRIKQAMGSVQLFAQRCLMGLEPDVQTSEGKWLQWEWMKNFRVWEANRKIWLYPENWIEPELRDDKTPFFKDLENELLQSDLDDAAAEQALLHYLEKLDQVGNLQIVGVYEDDEDKALHVFGRTFHTPHLYYYRRRNGTTKSWTPWEKVELDIEGDHLIPVIWNRKLMLIWPIFTEKQKEKPVVMPTPGGELQPADRYWDIQLAWSEYQNGRWSGKNLSEAVRFEAYQGEDNILFDKAVVAPQNTGAFAFKPARDTNTQHDGGNGGGNGGGSGGTNPGSPGSNTSTAPKPLISKENIAFKAFPSDKTLKVRGYLRRDYRAAPVAGDSQIACVFGEFQFFGCRKIVTTANHAQIARRNFALAPAGTKFDRMWFTETAPGLVLFDGTFVVSRSLHEGLSSNLDESPSIVGDPTSTVGNKFDIPVLEHTASFRLLAPHQEQFACDGPFFFMDGERTFMVTSTGLSGKKNRLNVGDLSGWVDANLATAWRADFFPPPDPALPDGSVVTTNPASAVTSLSILVPGPGGQRIAQRLVPLKLQPEFTPRTLLPIFWTTREYYFENFHHPYLCEFVKTLNRKGIAGLLSLPTQSLLAAQFFDTYKPQPRVLKEYPMDEVEFQSGRAYELYNWELFFHIPLLIADRLRTNQRFKEAQRWFHFIFDPTGASGGAVPQRYWITKPFNDRLKEGYEAESVKTIEEMVAKGISEELQVAVEIWRTNPFSPHAVARLRTTAYQKTVVMKYIDNLIAWGDQLFRRETLESLNEATQLYVLAAEILGRRPEVIQRNLKPAVQTFNSLDLKPGGLGNALEQIELLIPDAGGSGATGGSSQTPDPPSDTVLYFCVPENDKLLGYWNTVADRLFKIRHCMNIEGQVRQLPLFEPPIDPALLVRAQAAGLSIGDVLSDISTSLPNYRFSVMVQKANELVAEVRNLGAGLLSVLEKRDAEALALLRSSHEIKVLTAVQQVREKQIEEAKETLESLKKSRDVVIIRKNYYETRDLMNTWEIAHLTLMGVSLVLRGLETGALTLAGGLHLIPNFKIGAPPSFGSTMGGENFGKAAEEFGASVGSYAALLDHSASIAATLGSYRRRMDDWEFQARSAAKELEQIDKQISAAEIRLAIAERELQNHDLQVENTKEVDTFMREKFTNQDLYQFMIGQISGLYFQSYQLAYDLAKRAQKAFQHEIGNYDQTFIQFGYWDSLKKGLLAGDKLYHDLKRMDVAYLDQNKREYELTKHVSLLQVNPTALLQLRTTGKCTVALPEELFDMDGPGHYFRRIKNVALSIPCVTGPYTSVNCTLILTKSAIRKETGVGDGYARQGSEDSRFSDHFGSLQAIVTSSGQSDSGLFETNLRDERFLPFELSGVVSEWQLELPADVRQFDYDTISDVILHLRYTAREGGGLLRNGAVANLKTRIEEAQAVGSVRLFSVRHEFPSEWAKFTSVQNVSATSPAELALNLREEHYPFWSQGRLEAVKRMDLFAKTAKNSVDIIENADGTGKKDTLVKDNSLGGLRAGKLTNIALPAPIGKFSLHLNDNSMEDLWLALAWGKGD